MIVYRYGYPAGANTPDISPFVVKLETWLRMSGIPYETRTGTKREMPKLKLPVALIDGQLIADSTFIIEHLQKTDPRALRDQHLSASQRAAAEALKALLESHLYFVSYYFRWCVPENFDIYRPMLLDYARRITPAWQRALLPVIGQLVLSLVRKDRAKQAWQQGMARHSYDEVAHLGISAWEAVATLLADQPYFLGTQPSTIDATCFAFIHTVIKHPFPSPMQEFVQSHEKLVAYHDRIWNDYWASAYPQALAN